MAATEPATITPVHGFQARLVPGPLPYWAENEAAIAAHFEREQAANHRLFNGAVLVARRAAVQGGRLVAEFQQTPFATLLYWRKHGGADAAMRNCFGSAVVVSADGAILLGIMGRHTANAGRAYFPAGTPDLSDLTADGRVDLEASILRELKEEAGLDARHVTPSQVRFAAEAGRLVSCARVLRSDHTARELSEVIEAHIAAEAEPELDSHLWVRRPQDMADLSMPDFARALVLHLLVQQA